MCRPPSPRRRARWLFHGPCRGRASRRLSLSPRLGAGRSARRRPIFSRCGTLPAPPLPPCPSQSQMLAQTHLRARLVDAATRRPAPDPGGYHMLCTRLPRSCAIFVACISVGEASLERQTAGHMWTWCAPSVVEASPSTRARHCVPFRHCVGLNPTAIARRHLQCDPASICSKCTFVTFHAPVWPCVHKRDLACPSSTLHARV